jgi:hypothetical protein
VVDNPITSKPGIIMLASFSLSRVSILSSLMMTAGMVKSAKSHKREMALFVTYTIPHCKHSNLSAFASNAYGQRAVTGEQWNIINAICGSQSAVMVAAVMRIAQVNLRWRSAIRAKKARPESLQISRLAV